MQRGRGRGPARLLGLDGQAVVEVEDGPDGPVVHLGHRRRAGTGLSRVRNQGAKIEGAAVTHPRDLQVGGRRPVLVWTKRRWCCDQPEYPRGSFTETVAQVPPRKRLTARLRASAGAAVADRGRTIVQSARDHDLSWPVAAAAFTAHAEQVLPTQPDPVRVLGIDEIRRGRPRWVFDETTGNWATAVDRWHVGFVDLAARAGAARAGRGPQRPGGHRLAGRTRPLLAGPEGKAAYTPSGGD